jgi:ABC-type multidrug transport system ATPase subunit
MVIHEGEVISQNGLEQLESTHKTLQKIQIELDKVLDDATKNSLISIDGVESIVASTPQRLTIEVGLDVRSSIIKCLVKNDYGILESKIIESDLEDVFTRLTKMKATSDV